MGKFIDLKDKKFGRLIVICFSHSNNGSYWKCKCDCGNITTVISGNLNNGNSKSCGCLTSDLMRKKKTIHNFYGTPTYNTWSKMVNRCTNKNYIRYKDYGGRGIIVCDKWLKFEGFLEDMGIRPNLLSLERKDNNGGYNKENCKWDNNINQANNKRNSNKITYNNITKTLSQWARELNINRSTLKTRIFANNWSVERAFNTPTRLNKIIVPGGK